VSKSHKFAIFCHIQPNMGASRVPPKSENNNLLTQKRQIFNNSKKRDKQQTLKMRYKQNLKRR